MNEFTNARVEFSERRIDPVGMQKIYQQLATYNRDFDYMASRFVEPYIRYRGRSIAKRIASQMKNVLGIKISSDTMGTIGSIANQHEILAETYELSLRHTHWYGGRYGDGGSCFFASRRHAPQLLFDHGFCAVIINDEARCWAKFEDDHIIVFNGYGCDTILFAQLLAAHFGVSYAKKGCSNNGADEGLIYINDGSCYVVAADPDEYDDIDLEVDDSDYVLCDCSCFRYNCFEHISDTHEIDGQIVCADFEDYVICDNCGDAIMSDNVECAEGIGDLCFSCYNELEECSHCGCKMWEGNDTEDGLVCDDCFEEYVECGVCGDYTCKYDCIDGEDVCGDCYQKEAYRCQFCGEFHLRANMLEERKMRHDGTYNVYHFCEDCTKVIA